MLRILFLIIVFAAGLGPARCQSTHRDSLIKAARKDSREFRLPDTTWKKYKRRLPVTYDYFKPSQVKPEHRAFLSDSNYVQAYRKAAFRHNKHRRTPGHYVLVGGSVVAGLFVAAIAAILIFVAPQMG